MEKEAEQKTEDNNNNNEDVDADPNSPNSSSVQKTKRYVLFISFLVKKKNSSSNLFALVMREF